MKKTVVFVDDDRRLLKQYSTWVAENGFETAEFFGVDTVLDYLREGGAAEVIVWDMMMVPGKEFAGKDHGGGFSTGVLLYREMKRLRPSAKFILLTNKDEAYSSLSGQELVIRMKTETPPEDLATLINNIAAEPSKGGGA